jgi:signal recognition particle subunit SRP54
MNDLKMQLEQMMKMGGMEGMMGMMPGAAKMAKQMDQAGFDDSILKRQIALINSMTKKERANPDLLAASRKKRIAAGAGMEVSDLNKLRQEEVTPCHHFSQNTPAGGILTFPQPQRSM